MGKIEKDIQALLKDTRRTLAPKAFYLRISGLEEEDASLTRELARLLIWRAAGDVYLDSVWTIFFGFPTLDDDEALRRARQVLTAFKARLPAGAEADLHVSGWCTRQWYAVASHPLKHLRTEKLDTALRCYVGFSNFERYMRH